MLTLAQTVTKMLSDDYKDRFVAEYYQTKIRYDKLRHLITQVAAGTAEITPTCSLRVLETQLGDMDQYLADLEVRAQIEDIDLQAAGNDMVCNN